MATNSDEISSFLKNLRGEYISIIFLPVLGYIVYFFANHMDSVIFSYKIRKITNIISILLGITLLCIPGFPIHDFIVSIPKIAKEISVTEEYIKQKNSFHWNASSVVQDKSTVFIVIGETTRGDHMSINGYFRKTNPNLEKYDIITFNDVTSIGAHTLASTPYIFTRKPIQQEWIGNRLWPEKSFISAFKEAGYTTYYVSYLSNIHVGDNAINQIVNEADHYIQRPTSKNDDDSLGLPLIRKILQDDRSNKKLVIYKLVGSHYNFQDRYPDKFDYFKPSFKTTEFNGPNPKQKDIFINTYDNSILNTDFVVSEIIRYLKQENGEASLSFISDHGISIYEDGKTLFLNSKRANYNIPCFFWFNRKVKDRIGINKMEMLQSNTKKPVDQTYFMDTIFEVGGINTEKRMNKSLFDTISSEDERLVYYGNEIMKYKELEE